MTVGEIKTLIVSWLDDPQMGYFTPANLQVWINLAHRQVQMYLLQAGENYYMKPVETYTVTGQADYVLPSDFMVENRLEWVLSGTGSNENRIPLQQITTNQQDLITINQGQPTAYYIKKDRVTLSPTPDNVYLLRLYYSPMVADLTSDSDVPDIPEQYMEFVGIVAAYNGFVKDDRVPNNIAAKMEQFKSILEKMAATRVQDHSRRIVETNSYEFGAFGGAW